MLLCLEGADGVGEAFDFSPEELEPEEEDVVPVLEVFGGGLLDEGLEVLGPLEEFELLDHLGGEEEDARLLEGMDWSRDRDRDGDGGYLWSRSRP